MKKSIVTALLAALLWLPSIGSSEPSASAQGRPGRVLSLDLCTDWMLIRYADRDQVLALSPLLYEYPLDWVGSGWPTHDGSLEQILHLQPELVITGEYNAVLLRRRLQELGVRVKVFAVPHTLEQLSVYIGEFRRLLGLPDDAADTAPHPVASQPSSAQRPRLLLLGANGIGTGRQTFEDGVIQQAGWQNYLNQPGYRSLDLEAVVSDPPDAIFWSAPESQALANLFARHPALQAAVPGTRRFTSAYWQWECPGPWTRDLVADLRHRLPQ